MNQGMQDESGSRRTDQIPLCESGPAGQISVTPKALCHANQENKRGDCRFQPPRASERTSLARHWALLAAPESRTCLVWFGWDKAPSVSFDHFGAMG